MPAYICTDWCDHHHYQNYWLGAIHLHWHFTDSSDTLGVEKVVSSWAPAASNFTFIFNQFIFILAQ